jgi:hypothetical protein
MGQKLVTNPGGLTSFLLALTVTSRGDLLMRLAAAYPRLNNRERDNAFAVARPEIRRAMPDWASAASGPGW